MEVGVMGAENVVGSATTGAGGLGIILDVAVVVIMLIFAIVSAKKGFIESIFGLLTTVVAIVAAVFLANIVVDATGGLFGLKDSIHSGMLGFLEGIEGFNTDISKDGAMQGTNHELYSKLSKELNMNIIASGGVSSIEDVKKLAKLDIYGAIIGKAYYTKAISIKEAVEVAK
jgi:hypothetical protein